MMFSIIRRYTPLAILAALWEGSSRLGLIDPDSLPPFSAVCKAWWDLLLSGDLVYHGMSSLTNLLAGLSLAIVVGVTLGIVMGRVRLVDDIFGPLLTCIYPLPKAALIPVLIMWLGLGSAPKIVAVFIGSLLPIVTSAYNGARGIDRMLIWSALSAGAGRWEVLWDVVLPGAMPEILSGLRNALALSFILLVSSELLIGQRGLGYLISFLGEGGTYAGMFAGVLTVSAIGFLGDRLYLHVMRRTLSWQGE
jgi:ABC-type nitrate/sulfonate/bicarbonate transport system permease component